MAANKSVLEQMSDYELEKHIIPETTFAPEASKIAFEILKNRGRIFSEEETASINLLITKKEEKKTTPIHKNYILASNLIYASAFLSFVIFLLSPNLFGIGPDLLTDLFALSFVFFLAILVRRGYNWIKYLLIASTVLTLAYIQTFIAILTKFPSIGILNVFIFLLQNYALFLLFRTPKQSVTPIKINN